MIHEEICTYEVCKLAKEKWFDEPIAYLCHKPTHSKIAVFHKINFWQRWWIKICFGLKYEKL